MAAKATVRRVSIRPPGSAAAVLATLVFATGAGMADPGASASAKKRPKLAITKGDFGAHLTNAKGRALYVFTSDSGPTSNCYGACAVIAANDSSPPSAGLTSCF